MIVAHMIVGPGEAKRYLPQTLKATRAWADVVHVALDLKAGEEETEIVEAYADFFNPLFRTWTEHEGKFRQAAWNEMEVQIQPSNSDHILVIDADEIIVEHERVKAAAKDFPGKRVGFLFHEMWSATAYRTDLFWKPYKAWIMFPYRPDGRFRDRFLACGREPTYVPTLPMVGNPVANLLHYGYAMESDRKKKYDRYMKIDGGKYHNLNHLKSIMYPPELVEWKGGGLIDVYQETDGEG